MSVQHRQPPLSRLMIPPSLNSQQPVSFDNHAVYSPGLPTSIQRGMHPPYSLGPPTALQTPMQPVFFPVPPGAPGRPVNHRVHASIAQLAAAGIRPPLGMPMTPLGQGQFPAVGPLPQMMMPGQQFPPRSRRAPSISAGGPPKAVLGGPAAKSRVASDPATPPPAPVIVPPKVKKVLVNFPQETIPAKDDQPTRRQPWARKALQPSEVQELVDSVPPETTSQPVYPADQWRYTVPDTVDVFLPGRDAWDELRQRIVSEKLERLGIERGFGSSVNNVSSDVPFIHAPHARAASISSPADPALLFFKLNKLQQSQNASASNSLTSSPRPQVNLSPSPHLQGQFPPRMRHGHSMSLANPGSLPSIYNPTAAFNPFGPQAVLGSDEICPRIVTEPEPSSHVKPDPSISISLTPPPVPASLPISRPDFVVGFGLDIPEEEEPEEEVQENDEMRAEATDASTADDTEADVEIQEVDVSNQDQVNSRHRPRLSAALSLRSVGRQIPDPLTAIQVVPPAQSPTGDLAIDDLDAADKDTDAVGEWTGSEDLRNGVASSDEESIGEWSNPSDEERARQVRRQRRMTRRAQQAVHSRQDVPRKLPNFPRPPMSTHLPLLHSQSDDDMMSNPSDEERVVHRYRRSLSNASGKGRPLPPLPHSRATSSQFSHHDQALAHSRAVSEHLGQHTSTDGMQSQLTKTLAPSLNPLAKPFVFGTSQPSPRAPVSTEAPPLPQPRIVSHGRTVSVGRPLNATASEFKPTGFTFRPPSIAPQMSFTPPSGHDISAPLFAGRPLPTPPTPTQTSSREIQGREKRQRRGSSVTLDGDERKDTMTLFKFPTTSDIGKTIHKSAPPTPAAFDAERRNSISALPQPFTVDGFLSDMPLHKATEAVSLGRANNIPSTGTRELPVPPQPKQKRAPIPLDFKHPVSTNTVPAGLFKALVNGEGDDRSRRTVRSRLGSRDFFEHSPRPSLDDLNVPPISRKISKPRLVNDPGHRESSAERIDSPLPRRRRRSSLPALHSAGGSSFSDMSITQSNLQRDKDLHQLEQSLEAMFDKKLGAIRQDLLIQHVSSGSTLNEHTESMISEVVSLFRTQLQESATRGLDDSQLDARGELDFELVKGIIDQANMESRSIIQRDMAEVLRRVEVYTRSLGARNDLAPLVEDITSRTVKAVLSITQQLAARMEAWSSPAAIVHELMTVMTPHFASLRPEPIDYDGLTIQLSQAVKPNISQLIDLASDKRETAGLILERLLPVLQSLQSSAPAFDTDDMTTKIIAEVRKVVGQVDAHEIKEQVSDLVVERLDSRLANRDRLEGLADKVKEGVVSGLGPMPDEIASIFGKLATIHRDISELNPEDLSSLRHDVVSILSDLPSKLGTATEAMNAALIDLRLQRVTETDQDSGDKLSKLETHLSDLANDQKAVLSQTKEIILLHQDVVSHLSALPASLVEATNGLQDSQSDLVSRIELSQKDAEELRRLSASNSELQVQLTKARGAHGQVQVEKDVLAERLGVVEAEKDELRDQLQNLKMTFTTKSAEAATIESRNSELEEALAQALARLQSADASVQTHLERIAEFEKVTRDFSTEKQEMQSKAHSLHLEASLAARDVEVAQEKASALQKQLDQHLSQQRHWDEMHRAAEQIELLTSLVEQADNEELKELRRNRDRTKVLEGEFAALQRRFKDQENKISSHDRAMGGVRQNLAQAQQRAAEWEKRAKEQEAELETTRSRLDEADQAQTQLDAESSLVKLQLKEKEDDERVAKDRESKLRDQVASLEEQVARLRAETDQAKAKANAFVPSPRTNGATVDSPFTPPPRPDSRASTAYGPSRSVTPTSINGKPRRAYLASQGVWTSMHNPHRQTVPATPKARYSNSFRAPSPTSSVISTAPSVDEQGWWS